jgi:glycogen debranching enzyme
MTGDIRILDGNTYVVSDRCGNMDASPEFPTGFFAFDTRYLSKWMLTLNGQQLQPLSVYDVQYFEARFFLVPAGATHYVNSELSVIRQRSIGGGFEEQLSVLNHTGSPKDLTLRLDAASDFADILEIKNVLPKRGEATVRIEDGELRFRYERGGFCRETVISSTTPAMLDEQGLTFAIRLEPHGTWRTDVRVRSLGSHGLDIHSSLTGHPTHNRRQLRQELAEWLAETPRLSSDNNVLERAYQRSLVDLAALRFSPLTTEEHMIPAAGLPWFMAIFGRDSILTSLQILPFTPKLAGTTLEVLTGLQGSRLDDFRDEDPGKIMHEWRYGETAAFEEQPHTSYYGSADATPLFLVLLDEYERWTGDGDLVRRLEPEARAALDWIDTYGNQLGDGYLWYETRNEATGLVNQCWKDSPESISCADGSLPGFPRATCELQGYAYDAKRRAARLARQFWNDPAYADRLEAEAADLKERFNRDFWIEDGEYYALAIDAKGRRADVLSSNIGHLLWSGIVEPDRAPALVRHLLGPRLFSGWGVRTLAVGEERYNPVGYHVGTVWPFDNSLIAWGLTRYGFRREAGQIAQALIEASGYFDGRLPEAFAGYDRSLTEFPVEYPTACSPQAWSTGTPLLLLRTLLGLEPDGDRLVVDPAIPDGLGRIELAGVPGRWGRT